jgi:RNA exonuclease 4
MAPFFSKKAKAEMRSRKRRKQNATNNTEAADDGGDHSQTSIGTKRAANEITQSTSDDSDEPRNKKAKRTKEEATIIVVPSNLSSKDAKKFRKDERRKARANGIPEDKIQFKSQHQEEEHPSKETTDETTIKKQPKTKSFPRIKDLLAEHATQKKLLEQTAKQSAINDAVPPSEKEKYIAIDCEMVGIGTSGSKSALARASAVNWDGDILLDTFVQVPERVTDFRTHVSGVRPKDISPKNEKAMTHTQVREVMEQLLMGKILVGHALKNDLSVLLISHPKKEVRDTAKYKPFMRPSGRVGGKMRPRKLRDLVWENCGLEIQRKGVGHSSVEDARASMELFKCVRGRWEKELMGKSGGGGGSKGKK